MDWQLVVVSLVVTVAAFYLGRQTWRMWSARQGGCRGCGCGSRKGSEAQEGVTVIPSEQLTVRRRLPGEK
jgi:hypothetical protein